MASPVDYPLSVRIGDTETVSVTLQNSTGTAIDITGRTYAAQIRETAASTSVLASFTCVLVNAANGQFACTLSASTTAGLSPQMAVWDLQETYGTTVSTLLAGTVEINKDVTRT